MMMMRRRRKRRTTMMIINHTFCHISKFRYDYDI
jgi:hypothetical protein